MKLKKYAVRTNSAIEEKKLLVALTDSPGVEDYHASKGICCHSYVHFKCAKKVWKELQMKLGLRVVETYAAFEEED